MTHSRDISGRKRVALIRGEGLAAVELEYLARAGSTVELVAIGADYAELGRGARLLNRVSGARGAFVLSHLSREGRDLASSCDALWFADPYLRMTFEGAAWARRLQIPYVITVWENLQRHPSLQVRPWRSRAAEALRGAALIHCVTPQAAEYALAFDQRLARSVATVPPGVDRSRFAPSDGPPSGPHRFLFVGRLVEEKGVEELLTAYEDVRRLVSCELVVVGVGPLEDVVRAAARSLSGLTYLGFQDRDALPAIYRSCHTLVLPSRPRTLFGWPIWEEQFGFVLAEAMMSGLAVVASRSGSIPFVVGDTGWLVNPEGGAPALQEALVSAATDSAAWQRRSQLATARARREFDAATNADALLNVLCRAVS
ncbi:MAG: hypothetical protein QOF60_1789 [Actinomycetota bacterium]|jgi:glycosyltransferase involved in cell wall biosynthesis|nr:hypothetical protein [Actinomycetota bacterium]